MLTKLIRLAIHLAAIVYLWYTGINLYLSAAIVLAIGISSFVEAYKLTTKESYEIPKFIFKRFKLGYIPLLDFLVLSGDDGDLMDYIIHVNLSKELFCVVFLGIVVCSPNIEI